MKKLTQAIVTEGLPQEHDYYLSDHQVPGLACRILPSGIKTYYYRYTSPMDKKRKKVKIGDSNFLKLEEAREIAIEHRREIKKGNDPLIKQQAMEQNKSITFAEFWPQYEKEYILENHKASTIKKNKSNIKTVLNFFGHMPLDEIKTSDIIKFKNESKYKSCFTTCLSYLRTAMRHAELCDFRPSGSNPCLNITGWASNKRERYLSDEELTQLIKIIESEKKEGKRSVYPYYALRCLILSGQRKYEIVKLKWKDIDLKKKIALLPDSKSGKRPFVLSDQLISVLKEIPKRDENEYIFCGKKGNSYTKQIDDVWESVRAKINLEDVRIHDIRHSFASFHMNNGADLYSVSKLLGHKNINTTQRYAHLSQEKLLNVANQFVFK